MTRPFFRATFMETDPQTLIERLYENESLTDNLTDTDAKALLKWAEKQILASQNSELVTAAVSHANQSGSEGVQALLADADIFLAQALQTRDNETAPAAAQPDDTDHSARDAGQSTTENTMHSAASVAPQPTLGTLGAAAETPLKTLSAQADATVSPTDAAPVPAAKKPRRSRRKSGKNIS